MNLQAPLVQVHTGDRVPVGLTSPDVYFSQTYGRAAGVSDDGEWILLEAFGGAWQVPLVVRDLGDGAKDAISPYGYSGVYASTSLTSVDIQAAWSATVSALRELEVISVLLRHSPLVPQAPDLPGLISIVRGHPTIVVEPANVGSAWDSLAGTCRTRIRKALKNGYTGDVRQASSQDLAPHGDFRRLYEQTMQRLGATPLYFFSDRYYKELAEGLGSDLLVAEVRNAKGVPVSSALLMRHAHLLHYHLSGSNPDGARMGSNNLMMWTAAEFSAEQGLGQFHLGGGLNGRDGLFHFKQTFGGRELMYDVSGLIVNHESYQTRTKRAQEERGTGAEHHVKPTFFPAYRGDQP